MRSQHNGSYSWKGSTMMRLVLLLIVALCMPMTFGEIIQDSILYPTDSIHFQGFNIYVEANTDFSLLRVQIDDHVDFLNTGFSSAQIRSMLDVGETYQYTSNPRISYGPLTISLKEICANISKPNCARVNSDTLWLEPAYELELSLEESDVLVERKLSKSSLWLDEKSTLDITITNDGDVPISNFILTESFPLGIQVKSTEDWVQDGNRFSYKILRLQPGDSKSTSLKLTLTEVGDYSLKGGYVYQSQGETIDGLSSPVSISTKDLYDVVFSTNKGSYKLDDKGTGSITIKPLVSDDLRVDIEMLIPSGLSITSSDFEKDGSTLKKSVLLNGESKTFDFAFEGIENEYALFVFTNATLKVPLPVEVIEKKITYGDPETNPDELSGQLSFSETSILEGEPVRGELFLKGSSDIDFTNIKLNLTLSNTSKVSQKSFDIDVLSASNANFFFIFTPGVLNDSRAEEVTISGTYDSLVDDVLVTNDFSESYTLKVYTPQDALKVSRSVSPNPVEQNETTTVKVEIENLLDERIFDIFAKDSIPPDLLHKSVKTETQLSLRGLEKKLLYSYQLTMPFYVPNSTQISTRILSENFSFTESTNLSSFVKLKEPSLSLSSRWSSLVAGKPSQLRITISNSGDLALNRVSITAPLFQYLDLLSQESVFIPDLDPGESASLYIDYFVKSPKLEPSFITNIVSIDEYGNVFRLHDSSISFESDIGSGCGVIGSLTSENKTNSTYPLTFSIVNSCESTATVTLSDPSLLVELGPNKKKTVQFSKVLRGDYFEGVSFSYVQDGVKRISKTNALDLTEVDTVSITDSKSSSSSSGSSTSTQNAPDSEMVRINDLGGTADMGKKMLGVIAIVGFVFIFMTVLLKIAQKKSKDGSDNPEVEFYESSLVPPSLQDGVESVGLYVDEALKQGVAKIQIEEQLHYAGWNKDIIDKYLSK